MINRLKALIILYKYYSIFGIEKESVSECDMGFSEVYINTPLDGFKDQSQNTFILKETERRLF